MIEQIHKISTADTRAVEKVIQDENVHYNHMILPKDQGLPLHYSNSNVYMTVLRGRLSIALDEGETRDYEAGTLLKIPNETHMNVRNLHDEVLEITVVKAPAPGQ